MLLLLLLLLATTTIRRRFRLNSHLCRSSRLPPLLKDNVQLNVGILADSVHLDIVAVVAKGVFELRADALDAVEGEDDERDDGDGPPAELVDHGEGEHAAEEREDLFLVDSAAISRHVQYMYSTCMYMYVL